MKTPLKISFLIGALMVTSAAVTKVVTPVRMMADAHGKFNLETMIPASFGNWKIDTSIVPLQVDPEMQAKLNQIYNQTLSRTYVNPDGVRVMLSIAYGGDQDDSTGLHRPEVCYGAQGFDVQKNFSTDLKTDYGVLPVQRLMAVNGRRNEPISYWITVGNKAIKPGMAQRLRELRFGLSGQVTDGMLVRVSTIDTDIEASYAQQNDFIVALLRAVDDKDRTRLIGVFGG